MTAEVWTPDCMEGDEYADWMRTNRALSSKSERADRPCADCLPAFAMEMRGEGRCNGLPMGHVRSKEEPMPEPMTLAGKRQPVAIVAPCGTCAHADVCRIRPALEGVRSLSVIAPETDDAITFVLSASVSCDHYTKAKPRTTAVDRGGQPVPVPGRRLNLTDEERERRRQQAIAMTAARREQETA